MSETSQQGSAGGRIGLEDDDVPFIDNTPAVTPAPAALPYRHVTNRMNRSGVSELTTMLESMYLDHDEGNDQQDDEDEDDSGGTFAEQLQLQFAVTAENRSLGNSAEGGS